MSERETSTTACFKDCTLSVCYRGKKTHPYTGTSKLPLSGLFALFLSEAPLSCSDIVFNIGLVALSLISLV